MSLFNFFDGEKLVTEYICKIFVNYAKQKNAKPNEFRFMLSFVKENELQIDVFDERTKKYNDKLTAKDIKTLLL